MTKSRLFLVLHLIGWEDGTNFSGAITKLILVTN